MAQAVRSGDHRGGRQVGGVADEPHRHVVVDGSGLAGRGLAQVDVRPVAEAAGLLHAPEDVVDRVRDVAREHLVASLGVLLEGLAVAVEDLRDRAGVAVEAAAGEGRVGLRHGQRVGVDDAERERRVDLVVGDRDAHGPGQLDRLAQAGPQLELGEEGVHRLLGAGVEVEGAGARRVLGGPVLGALDVAVAVAVARDRDRDALRRGDLGRERDALPDRRGEDERLEGRSGLEAVRRRRTPGAPRS